MLGRALDPFLDRRGQLVVGPVLVLLGDRRIDHAGDVAAPREDEADRPLEQLGGLEDLRIGRNVVFPGRLQIDRHLYLRQIELDVAEFHVAQRQRVVAVALRKIEQMHLLGHPRGVGVPVQKIERRRRLTQ